MIIKAKYFTFLILFIYSISLNAQEKVTNKEKSKKFIILEEPPILPGCEAVFKNEQRTCFQAKISEHVAKNFRYPKKALKRNLEGKATVLFIIDKEGKIAIKNVRATNKIFKKEAIRILKLLPKAIPGKANGKSIEVHFAYPINFKL